MTRRLASALLAIGVLVGGTSASAHDEYRFIGSLTAVDTAKPRISVTFKENGKDETVHVVLNGKTVVTRDKKKVDRSTLKVGLYVVIDALGDDYDSLEAVEIRIVPPPKPTK